jgi:hypothetical protein
LSPPRKACPELALLQQELSTLVEQDVVTLLRHIRHRYSVTALRSIEWVFD